MKKFISFIIVLTMLVSTTTSFAAPNFSDFVDSLGGEYYDGQNLLQDVPVPTDISVKTQSGTDFENGPLILSLYNAKNTKFSFRASIDMEKVKERYQAYEDLAQTLIAGDTALEAELNNCTVSGQFKITVYYPTTDDFTVNSDAEVSGVAMPGFTSENGRHLEIFEEVSRDTTTEGKIIITIKVKDTTTLSDLDALSDLYLTYDDNRITAADEYTIRGEVEGYTTIKYNGDDIDTIEYLFSQEVGKENDADYRDPDDDISATVIVQGGDPSPTLGGGTKHTLTIFDEEDVHSKKQYVPGTTIETGKLPIPKKDGYVFAGYYYDKEFTKPVEETFKLTENVNIYVKWQKNALDEANHFAFIIGYPMEDGREEVRPEINMTREEIATVFYRLLKDEVRDELFTAENSFPDVAVERWSNKAISTIAKGGYINGYEDGTFKPAQPITRAEFVTIAARFYAVDEVYANDVDFADVKGHWAEKYINYATASGWIDGYEDNTFRPDRYITRAEVMKIINHMLDRRVNEEGLVSDAKRWVDNSKDKWYYYEVIEATNFHAFDRAEGETYETWTEILENEILVDKPEYEDA